MMICCFCDNLRRAPGICRLPAALHARLGNQGRDDDAETLMDLGARSGTYQDHGVMGTKETILRKELCTGGSKYIQAGAKALNTCSVFP